MHKAKLSHLFHLICLVALLFSVGLAKPVRAAATTYYVSSSGGSDGNLGTTSGQPWKTIAKVNSVSFQPGDQVLFVCGDTWRAESLVIKSSGASGSPITFSSYPAACANQPVLSGAQPIGGWAPYSAHIYVADLSTGSNAGKFPNGINQLFRDGQRLALGRWPNLGSLDNGYSTVDAQPSAAQLTDNQLPPGNWSGATLHIKVIRWSMVNRTITAQNGSTLSLNMNPGCWGNSCTGWGFFINNSFSTLDSEGEWYYEKGTHRLYIYTSANPVSSLMEGSVVLRTDDRNDGGVVLGTDLGKELSYVIVDNLAIRDWYRHGIASPTNFEKNENTFITLRNNTILDVDDSGINLFTWVYAATDGADGWRGGNNLTISNNLIQGANSFGIHTPSRQTLIENNTIRDVALPRNLNEAGMGCGVDGSEGTCTEDGAGLRIYTGNPVNSGYGFTVRYNRFENIGYNGIQMFGSSSTFNNNVFLNTCASKGDGGAINTFGNNNLATSYVHDINVLNNIIDGVSGNTDGARADFKPLFGFGLYFDMYSRNVVSTGNIIARSSVAGILYQNSTGSAQNNVLFDNANGSMYADQVHLTGSPTTLTAFTGNVMVAFSSLSRDFSMTSSGQAGSSDNNRFFHDARSDLIFADGAGRTLAQWQSATGKDAHSSALVSGQVAGYVLTYNDTQVDKPVSMPTNWDWCDALTGAKTGSGYTLAPFGYKITYPCGPAPFQAYLPGIWK